MTPGQKQSATVEDELRSLFENAPEVMYTHDLAGKLTRVNRAFERMTGYSRREILRTNFLDLVAPEYQAIARQLMMEQIGGGRPQAQEIALRTLSGEVVMVEISTEVLFSNGTLCGMQGFARDMRASKLEQSARTSAESQLLVKTNELARFSRHLQVLHRLSTTNHENLELLFRDYTEAGCEIFGVREGALTQVVDGVARVRCVHSNDAQIPPPEMDRYAEEIIIRRRTLLATPDRSELNSFPHAVYIGTPILIGNDLYGTIGFWTTEEAEASQLHPQAREIIEMMAQSIAIAIHQRQLANRLAHQARHDALTGLPNRLLLQERLDMALEVARGSQGVVAVAFIDLDRFKQINDTLGHGIGDRLLQQVARRLDGCMMVENTLARMGGDEFTAIVSDIRGEEDALPLVHAMLASVRLPFMVQGHELFVTASVGVSLFPKDGQDAETLLRNADSAMYAAKSRGKNDYQFFSLERSAVFREKLELENALRRAIENGELRLLYQPQVELDGKLAGFEVLLAWQHPGLGRISPTQFIPIAEESGMILQIGAWVLRQACQQAARWAALGDGPLKISVNVSALQLAESGFVATVASILSETDILGVQLELEITESVLMQDVEQAIKRMKELREIGVKIAIDDFGTGYSSLNYLRRLPADSLKIDQSFLRGIQTDSAALPLVRAIVRLAHDLSLSVTAEGVETEPQLDLIRSAGCDLAQGHLFGAALSVQAAEDLLICGRTR